MKKSLIVAGLIISTSAFSQAHFPMGEGMSGWGVPLEVPNTELSLLLGARFQSLASFKTEKDYSTNKQSTEQDFQARRVRFQIQADLGKKARFYMDVRNDNANAADKGEQTFNVGDAYVLMPLKETADSVHAVRLYRSKIDVSRTETVSSSELAFVNRPYIADEAAQFVSHNRRASNIQLIGHFFKKVSYQVAIGDGVHSKKFNDAQGNPVTSIEKQNFMIGGKLRFHPFEGWEDLKPTETYFGKGKHFSFGLGQFNTSKIHTVNGAGEREIISRNLTNMELSTHYGEWQFNAEYFLFNGVVEDHSANDFRVGKGEGWFAQGEKVFADFHYLAPFARFESWDHFITAGDYLSQAQLYGVNWYLNGNRFRLSIAYEINQNGEDTGEADRAEAYHIASMWHF